MEFVDRLNKYIPSLVLQHLLIKQERESIVSNDQIQLPELQSMETVVMFADISGFTNLSEACAKKGFRGNEDLAFCINRYLECMIKSLQKFGGDIIKFVGDAMIIMWPELEVTCADLYTSQQFTESRKSHVDLESYQRQVTVRKAVQCALEMQSQLNNMQVLPGIKLSVKIGIGFGPCALLYVGGVFRRTEFFTIGEALKQALGSEGMCDSGGQIVISNEAYDLVYEYFSAQELKRQEDGQPFYKISALVGAPVKTRADANMLRNEIMKQIYLTNAVDKLQACVPAAIVPYLRINMEEFGASNRSLTVMFASLGVELSSAETEKGLHHIQNIVTTVQKQVYRLQGSLNKLVMDDKGSTLICLWGLSPFSHEDDAARAVLTAFNIIRELNKINTWCNIGISSGECFSGVVGTAGARKEFSVLGDVVNLAARIMGSLKYQRNVVACSQKTRILAQNYITFNYGGHKEFKGKSVSIPIYIPVDPCEQLKKASDGVQPLSVFLQPHMNRLDLNGGVIQATKAKTYGFESILADLRTEIIEFFRMDTPLAPCLITIKGQVGQGKTLLMLNLIDELRQSNSFKNFQALNGDLPLPIVAGNINPDSDLQFLNIWRPILRQLLGHYCKKQEVSRSKVIEVLLNSTTDAEKQSDKKDIICDLFDLTNNEKLELYSETRLPEVVQIRPKFSMFPFVERPEYEDQHKDDIVLMLYHFFKIAIGEGQDICEMVPDLYSGIESQSMESSNSQQTSKSSSDEEEAQREPFIIILDNAHMLDPASWDLYEAVRDGCYGICLILLLQTDLNDDVKIHAASKQTFDRIWQGGAMEDNRVIELPNLTLKSLESMLLDSAEQYQKSYREEVKRMTEIENPKQTLKDPTTSLKEISRQMNKWQLHEKFKSFDERVLKVILRNCGSMPLYCQQYFVNLIQDSFIEIRAAGVVVPTHKFKVCHQLDDWKSVQVPRLALKQICTYLDKYLWQIQTKKNRKASEVDNTVKSIIQMKSATVCSFGNDFHSDNLKIMSHFQVTRQDLNKLLRLLEKADLIEIVDESDPRRVHCRFIHAFFKDALYQVMLYKGVKKDLHEGFERLIQNMPVTLDPKKNEVISQSLRLNMLLAQDVTTEDQLNYARRTGLTVRRLQNALASNKKGVLLRDILLKQGEGFNKRTEKRLVILTAKDFSWYHDESEFYNRKPLGKFDLEFVYSNVKSFQVHNDRPTFMISTTIWTDKKGREKGKREFFFSCDTEHLRDKWMIAIDFLKTKATYDVYTSKNRNVGFNIEISEEIRNNDEDEQYDREHLISNFGTQLKQKTTMVSNMQQAKISALIQKQKSRNRRRSSIGSLGLSGLQRMTVVQRQRSSDKRSRTVQSASNQKQTKKQKKDLKMLSMQKLGSQGNLIQLMSQTQSQSKDEVQNRKDSFLRKMTSSLYMDEPETPKVQADQLVSKMKLLYATSIVGFLHHVENTACKLTEKQRHYNIGQLNEDLQEEYQNIVSMTIMNDKLDEEKRQNEKIKKTNYSGVVEHFIPQEIAINVKLPRKSAQLQPTDLQPIEEFKLPHSVTSSSQTLKRRESRQLNQSGLLLQGAKFGTIREETKENNELFETHLEEESNIITKSTRREELPPLPFGEIEPFTCKQQSPDQSRNFTLSAPIDALDGDFFSNQKKLIEDDRSKSCQIF